MSPLNRRSFLSRSLTTLGAGGFGAAVGLSAGSGASADPRERPLAVQARDVQLREFRVREPFDGARQSGILTPRQAEATFVSLDSIAANRTDLFEALQAISTEARLLTQGDSVGVVELDDPPPDSGILGPSNSPDSLTVTIAFGASLFDHRYGLAALRPARLTPMPAFAHDELNPDITGGDILLQICAGQRDTVVHTVRELMRAVAGKLAVRWTLDGFHHPNRGPRPSSTPRNLFAFRDGTANPDVNDEALMDRLIWIPRESARPAWTAGGTYVAFRTIRMHVEFWDRVGMFEQQQMIGRERVSGAPLGGSHEFENPDYPSDPHGRRIPLNAHIRLANPRTAVTADQRILRRGYSYSNGVDTAGDLDQGLAFVAFNQDPRRQFATIQSRLEAEPMSDYITPIGGGYFFAPRGADGPADWIGSGLSSV
jgi:deferrochelatase/peroxidase EfeB